jgi:4-amino-4-deoxy-L-arabinose transferase-like glycosyltransferase
MAPTTITRLNEAEPDDRNQAAGRGPWYAIVSSRWSLPAVLAVQVALSARLIWTTTAFQDEALYLWAGHLELDHLVRNTPVPGFSSYFSGAPVLYPPVGAVADHVGGLAAARLLSLAFMVLATVLLHGLTRRIFGSRLAAFFAAALFAGLGPTAFLGAFATYDAMALALLAVATWLGVRSAGLRSAGARPAVRVAVVAAAGTVLALANATKYASGIFDPVVIGVVALAVAQRRGAAAGALAATVLTTVTGGLLSAGYLLAGPGYRAGVQFTTLTRAAGTNSPSSVLMMGASWVGVVVVLALAGAVVISHAWWRRPTALLGWVLFLASLLAPVEQARISTSVSLFKHVDYGAWFAAAAAGYLFAALPNAIERIRGPLLAGGLAVLVMTGALGTSIVSRQYAGWPDSGRLTSAMRSLARPDAVYLVEDSNVESYYLRATVTPRQMANTFYFGYTDSQTGQYLANGPAYAAAIKQRYLALIVLDFMDTVGVDREIVADIRRYGGYRRAATIPFHTAAGAGRYEVWERLGG